MANTNQITAAGAEVQSFVDIQNQLIDGDATIAGLKTIYGADISVSSNSPDGQMVANLALTKEDMLRFGTQIYDAFDPAQAVGAALDALCALCGIYRAGGSYTQVNISITASRSVSLTAGSFTVQDSTGNKFDLVANQSLTAGTTACLFIAQQMGVIDISLNTITTIATPTLGITAVNNASAPTVVGVDQETDAQLRTRRDQSVANPSQRVAQSLRGELLALPNMTNVTVYENKTASTDAKGILAHGIWVICDGGVSEDIADVIYAQTCGNPLTGATSVNITQTDGHVIAIAFDQCATQALYIHITATSKTGATVDANALKASIVAGYTLSIYEPADVTSIATIARAANSDLVIGACTVSNNNSTFVAQCYPTAYKNKFTISTANITVS